MCNEYLETENKSHTQGRIVEVEGLGNSEIVNKKI